MFSECAKQIVIRIRVCNPSLLLVASRKHSERRIHKYHVEFLAAHIDETETLFGILNKQLSLKLPSVGRKCDEVVEGLSHQMLRSVPKRDAFPFHIRWNKSHQPLFWLHGQPILREPEERQPLFPLVLPLANGILQFLLDL